MKRRISLSKSLSLIYGLEFTGFIKLERVWWWRNYIETTKYQEIIYPKEGYICVVRLNNSHKHRNTIRVLTKQSNSDKRELVVLKKLFGKEKFSKPSEILLIPNMIQLYLILTWNITIL